MRPFFMSKNQENSNYGFMTIILTKTIDTKAVKMAFQRRLADYFNQSLLLNREKL